MSARGNVRVSIKSEFDGSGTTAAERSLNRFGKAGKQTGTSLGTLAKQAVGVATAFAGIAEAKQAIETTDTLAKSTLALHRNLGLSIKTASEWAATAKARDIDTKALNQTFGIFSKNVEAASQGSKKQAEAFKALGVSQADLKQGDFNKLIGEASDGLRNLAPGTHKAALEMGLFGRGWQTVVPVLREGSKSMQGQLDLANKYGATFGGKSVKSVEDLVKAQRELKLAQLGLQVQFTEKVAPALIKISLLVARVVNFFEKNRAAAHALVGVLVIAVSAWAGYRVAALLSAAATAVATGGISLIIPVIAAFAAGVVLLYEKSAAFRRGVEIWWKIIKNVVVGAVHVILTVLDKFLGGLQGVMDAASHLPIVGKKFGKIADDIGKAREKVRGLRDAVDNLNGRKVSVKVQVDALLNEFQSGKIPKLIQGKIPPPPHGATGMMVNAPMYVVGEEAPQHPEYVLATNPAYRNRNVGLWQQAGHDLGIPGFAAGGKLSLGHPGGQIRQAATEMAESASAQWLKAHPMRPSGSSGGPPGGPVPAGSPRNWLTKALRITGHYSAANLSALYLQMMSESGGNPFAINLWDSNAKAGHPSKGLLQTIDSTFNTYSLPGLGNIWNPIANTVAAIRYMYATYGHIVGTGHGYRTGGIVGFKKGKGPPHTKPISSKPPRATGGHPQKIPPKAKLKKPGPKDRYDEIQSLLDNIDLGVQAGFLTPEQGNAQKLAVLNYSLAHAKASHLTGQEFAQLTVARNDLTSGSGDTGGDGGTGDDLAQQQIDATNALNASIQALKDQVKAQTDYQTSSTAIQNTVVYKALADLMSGQIANNFTPRTLLASGGSVVSY